MPVGKPRNAFSEIVASCVQEIVIFCIEVQPLNAFSPRKEMPWSSTSLSEVQSSNALLSTRRIPFPLSPRTDTSFLQSLKASLPIDVRPFLTVIVFMPVPLSAPASTSLTLNSRSDTARLKNGLLPVITVSLPLYKIGFAIPTPTYAATPIISAIAAAVIAFLIER